MRQYLLDRDLMSQLDQPEKDRHENVKAWFNNVPDDALHISAATVMEEWKGLARQRKRSEQDSSRLGQCERYEEAFDRLVEAFADRVVPVDAVVAKLWGQMIGQQEKHHMDVCLAATAIVFGMVVATRNTKHFVDRGAHVVNPFPQDSRHHSVGRLTGSTHLNPSEALFLTRHFASA